MSKTLVFCADGTWDNPGVAGAAGEGCEPQLTNVCKLFGWLRGELDGPWGRTEMESCLKDAAGGVVQQAKYIHGVGDSTRLPDKLLGGAFGVGVTARIARGLTWLSRNYAPGDRIAIVGFSRGAYTARALAGLIVAQGLLRPELATSPDDKYDNAVAAWFRWRHASDTSLQKWIDGAEEFGLLHAVFGNAATLTDDSFVPIDALAAVAVWDTVGSLGIPAWNTAGERVDLYEFCNRALDPKIALGLHAVSLDERRDAFVPTLWDPAPSLTQAVFAGGHCDVGGGYPEHGLSDVPLLWFADRLQHADVGLLFDLQPPTAVAPDPLGASHREWAKPWWAPLGVHPRVFPATMVVNDAVRQRMNGGAELVAPPLDPAAPYAPVNLPK